MIVSDIYDKSLNRKKMYYDLGEERTVTVMLKDSLAYVMPYEYKSSALPTDNYFSFVRHNGDQYVAIYFQENGKIIIGPKWNIDNIKMEKSDYELFGDYLPVTRGGREINNKTYTCDHVFAINSNEKQMLDSLSCAPQINIVYDDKPLIMDVRRVNGDRVEQILYRGYKEDENMRRIIKE